MTAAPASGQRNRATATKTPGYFRPGRASPRCLKTMCGGGISGRSIGLWIKTVADQLGHALDVNQNVCTRASIARRKEAVDALESALPVV